MENPYIVYVKTNDSGYITAVNSSAFLTDTADLVEIDSGYGDKYHHAQGNYFPMPIMDMRGIYRYKLVEGAVIERTAEEMDADAFSAKKEPTQEQRIAELEEALALLLSGVTE